MNWHDFAQKSDRRAQKFYQELHNALNDAYGNTHEGWLKVPKKVERDLRRTSIQGDPDYIWSGFDWVKVKAYETHEGVFARLVEFQ